MKVNRQTLSIISSKIKYNCTSTKDSFTKSVTQGLKLVELVHFELHGRRFNNDKFKNVKKMSNVSCVITEDTYLMSITLLFIFSGWSLLQLHVLLGCLKTYTKNPRLHMSFHMQYNTLYSKCHCFHSILLTCHIILRSHILTLSKFTLFPLILPIYINVPLSPSFNLIV